MRFTRKEAQRLCDIAERGQNIKAELADRDTINQGMRILKPNHGESLFIYAMRTIAPDLLALHPVQDVEVFPGSDNRRVDFSFLPIPLVIEVQGSVHQIGEKLYLDWCKTNDLQLAGCMVLQFTPEQLERDPYFAVEKVRAALELQRGKTTSLSHKEKVGDDY